MVWVFFKERCDFPTVQGFQELECLKKITLLLRLGRKLWELVAQCPVVILIGQ